MVVKQKIIFVDQKILYKYLENGLPPVFFVNHFPKSTPQPLFLSHAQNPPAPLSTSFSSSLASVSNASAEGCFARISSLHWRHRGALWNGTVFADLSLSQCGSPWWPGLHESPSLLICRGVCWFFGGFFVDFVVDFFWVVVAGGGFLLLIVVGCWFVMADFCWFCGGFRWFVMASCWCFCWFCGGFLLAWWL